MSDVMMLRIGIAVVGVILIIAMVIFGRPKKAPQGRRVESGERGDATRVEPSLGGDPADPDYSGEGVSQPDLGLADPGAGDSDLASVRVRTSTRSSRCTWRPSRARCCAARTSWWPRRRPA